MSRYSYVFCLGRDLCRDPTSKIFVRPLVEKLNMKNAAGAQVTQNAAKLYELD
jgi:hypothetical protein